MRIFISHTSKDENIAEYLCHKISSLSLGKIRCWFCNDRGPNGGYEIGDQWYRKIINELENCDCLIVLVTPNSHDKPWIYYESGYAFGLKKVIIPVLVGVRKENLNSTLKNFQGVQLTSQKELESLFTKLFSKADLSLDIDTFIERFTEMIKRFSEASFENDSKETNEFVEHLEEFRMELLQKLSSIVPTVEKKRKTTLKIPNVSINFILKKGKHNVERNFVIEIGPGISFQDVTNEIFFNLSDLIKPFTYLEEWIISNEDDDKHLVIREVASLIPSTSIFNAKDKYKITLLSKPYSALDSKNRIMKT